MVVPPQFPYACMTDEQLINLASLLGMKWDNALVVPGFFWDDYHSRWTEEEGPLFPFLDFEPDELKITPNVLTHLRSWEIAGLPEVPK